ncbi:MAG: cell wall hydrolase, partial [Caulobacteraceae bacterium]|nr:cell wall hydrolase [Caulobacteraceae bacterium]
MFRRLISGIEHHHRVAGLQVALVVVLAAGLATAAPRLSQDGAEQRIAKVTGGQMDALAFARVTRDMDPAMMGLAARFAPGFEAASFARMNRESGLIDTVDGAPEPAVLRLQDLDEEQSRLWNAANPVSTLPNPAAKPFRLTGGALHQARALDCMAAAIYYEARYESLDGQRAVAQVVINRVRHPAYPNSVCGVVFQGSNRTTGCQFTFTCDGAMGRMPDPEGWARARQVAEAALSGYVMKGVGHATHYHANYVAPYWSPSLVKVATVGAHIFYRWMGGWGLPGAFGGAYGGDESVGFQIAALNRISGPAQV